jgi:CheY-like chemotaxis protein
MRKAKIREVSRSDLSAVTNQLDLESPESLHVALLGEDIIIEEEPDKTSGSINVLFTYDEFMEYMIAKSMLRSCLPVSEVNIKNLIIECQEGVDHFPSFIGVLEYLSIILREDHTFVAWTMIDREEEKLGDAICRALAKLEPALLGEPEISVLRKLTLVRSCHVRASATQCLVLIMKGKPYDRQWREGAVEVLKELLGHEEEYFVRIDALQGFEDEVVTSLNETARSIASWWRNKQEEAKSKLIVWSDTEEHLLLLGKTILEDKGFRRVQVETDTLRTIQLVERVKPDLIITNMVKPDISADAMARLIKRNPELSQIPILLFTTQSSYPMDYRFDTFCGLVCKSAGTIEEYLPLVIKTILAGNFVSDSERGGEAHKDVSGP